MNLKIYFKRFVIIPFLTLVTCSLSVIGQEVKSDWQTRTAFEASFKLAKKLKLNIAPELRFEDKFQLDRTQLEGELEYKLLDFLSLGGRYRFIINYRDKKETEYLNRYMLSATFKHKFNRWKPGLRISYTDYTDDNEGSSFIRYKAFLEYNIKDCKLSPNTSVQAYHDLEDSAWYKMRYAVGFDYKLFKNNSIGLSYKLDYYLNEARNRHIIDIGYKIKF